MITQQQGHTHSRGLSWQWAIKETTMRMIRTMVDDMNDNARTHEALEAMSRELHEVEPDGFAGRLTAEGMESQLFYYREHVLVEYSRLILNGDAKTYHTMDDVERALSFGR
jgi:hypothetical protein